MADDFSPIYQGDTGAPFNAAFTHADGTPMSLVGATLSMKMQGASSPIAGTVITCTGTWLVTDAANGLASYSYASADVATAGTWLLYITITIGGKPEHADIKTLQILPTP